MADAFELEVATPERELVRENVESAQIPGKNGYLGILPGHAALVGELGIGFMSYQSGNRLRYLSVAGGFLEVQNDRVRVLADVAERAEEIDVERARKALERAQDLLRSQVAEVNFPEAMAAELRALARLGASERK